MTGIKLEGFEIYNSINLECCTYLIPIYSHTCECQIKVYLITYRGASPLQDIFKPKYLEKYERLRYEKLKQTRSDYMIHIPHFRIKQDTKCSVHHAIETNDFYKPSLIYNESLWHRPQDELWVAALVDSLKKADKFEIGSWLASYAINYWAATHYGWYINLSPQFNLSVKEKKSYLLLCSETELLDKINEDIDSYKKEVYGSMENMIYPLVNIILEYNYSTLHLMGKVIGQFKRDIEAYMVIDKKIE
ncbi:MAG: hypothetical protein Harvfovirus68_7 [Harvfovirus sp.]|uniref:Uncharacterized protein n=1 Tax=Harvfovirus sp. TaxID=2487768 RepID=A0A3G5A3P2_9VIRU|nr:MAG: hypothetical protein Harvfovirus68_7 [Harvfovirus sp.]